MIWNSWFWMKRIDSVSVVGVVGVVGGIGAVLSLCIVDTVTLTWLLTDSLMFPFLSFYKFNSGSVSTHTLHFHKLTAFLTYSYS